MRDPSSELRILAPMSVEKLMEDTGWDRAKAEKIQATFAPIATAYGSHRCLEEDAISYHMALPVIRDMMETLRRLANIADTAASILHNSNPEEAALFAADAELARTSLAKAKKL